MEAQIKWNDNMSFSGTSGNNSVAIDAKSPFGKDTGVTPKEMVALAIASCSGMDVISLLKKYKQLPTSFKVNADVEQTDPGTYPVIFKTVKLVFLIDGEIEIGKAQEAVKMSMTEYCGVAAMIAKSCPITYEVKLNGITILEDEARF